MSLEGKVLSSVLNDKQIHVLLQGNVASLLKTHSDVWNFIQHHYEDNKSLPSHELVSEKFPDFDYYEQTDGTKYHLQELRSNYVENGVRTIIRNAAQFFQDGKVEAALDGMILNSATLKQMSSPVRDVDIKDTDSAVSHIETVVANREQGSLGIRTGLPAFDACLPAGIYPGHFGVLLAYPGIGKAMPLDTPVLTPDGWVNIGELSVGDKVIARNGHPTDVVGIPFEGEQDSYLVTLNDGGTVKCGPNHEWTVYSRDGKYKSGKAQIKTTAELIESGLHLNSPSRTSRNVPGYKWFLPTVDPVKHSEKDFSVEPYTLGILLGDGSMCRETVYFTTNDEFCAEEIQRRNPNLHVNKYARHLHTAQRYSITPRYMGAMRALGLNQNSHHKRVPQHYFFGSHKQRLDLLRGLMDSDGSVSVNKKAIFHSRNMGLAEDVQQLVWSLGGTAKISTHQRLNGIDITVSFWTPDNPFLLERKAVRYTVRDGYRAIKSIERVGSEKMRCISVADAEHLYVTKDYIVTHNSWMMAYLAVRAWLDGKTSMIISLEMTEEEVRDRLYTIIGKGTFSHRKLSAGYVDVEDFKDWHHKTFEGMPSIHIVASDAGAVTPSVVQGKIEQYKPDIVFLDYLNLMSPNGKVDGEIQKMKQLSTQLKMLAKNERVPIVAISSATPDDVTDMSSAPTLGQVAWSKQISYDADWLIALGREQNSDVIYMVFRKNRNGALGEFAVIVDFDKGLFTYKGID